MIHPCSDKGGYRKFGYKLGNLHHCGHDYNTFQGDLVKSICNGKIIHAGLVAGFGSFGKPGGVVVIKHFDKNKKPFTAIYGHINISVKQGDTVKEGDVVGSLIRYETFKFRADHLHFCIHVGEDLPPFPWGYRSDLSGYIDPIKFINEGGILNEKKQ